MEIPGGRHRRGRMLRGAADGRESRAQDLMAAIDDSVDPVALIRRITEQVCVLTATADGAAVSLLTEDGTFFVVSAHGVVETLQGWTFPRDGTFVGEAIATGRPQISADMTADGGLLPQIRDMAGELGLASLAVFPLLHRDEVIGALSMTARGPDTFDADDIAAMDAVARMISAVISSHTELASMLPAFLDDPHLSSPASAAQFLASVLLPDMVRDSKLHLRLDALLSGPERLEAVFQPIVDLPTATVVGFEGLSRFPADADLAPWQWFEAARRLGRSRPLELAALQRVVAASDELPADCFLAVNVSPLTAMEPVVADLLLAVTRPLVVEITEHEPFPEELAEALKPLRAHGIRLAIDDAGAGYASFTQLLRLRPDIIKVDGALTLGIDDDPVKRALVSAIVMLAAELDAVTVAESIEEDAQGATLQRLGMHLGQGYLFGRPAAAACCRQL